MIENRYCTDEATVALGQKVGRPSLQVQEEMEQFRGIHDPRQQRARLQASLQWQERLSSGRRGTSDPALRAELDWDAAQEEFKRLTE
eukprot:5868931-Amphidinium_carterae.1